MARGFEKWEIAVAKSVVNSFLRSNEIRGYEFDDLLQECLLHWYQNRGKYRPDREASEKTFMARILTRRLQEILRGQLADKRRVNQVAEPIVVSTDREGSEGDGFDLSDQKQEEQFKLSQENFGLSQDLRTGLSKLSPPQKRLYHLIMEGHPTAHISEILHKPRTTLYDEIGRIQRIFLDEGLKEYLE